MKLPHPRAACPTRDSHVDSHGLVGGIGQYEDIWRMAYVRGPEGIIVTWPSESADPREAVELHLVA